MVDEPGVEHKKNLLHDAWIFFLSQKGPEGVVFFFKEACGEENVVFKADTKNLA